MEFEIKNKYFIIAIVVLLLLSFGAGWGLNDHFTQSRDSEYQERISSLTGELEAQRNYNTAILNGLRWTATALATATETVTGLEESNRRLAEENRRIASNLGDLSEGMGEDTERLGGIIQRLDGYLKNSE